MNKFGNTSKTLLIFTVLLIFGIIITASTNSLAGFIPNLAMAIPLVNLPKSNTANMAGISSIVYVAEVDDIETFPTFATTKTLPEHSVDLIGDFVMKATKYFSAFYSTQEMGELISEVEGNRDGQYFRNTGSFFYPNTTSRALGIANILKNKSVIIIIKEFNCDGTGIARVVGDELLPAFVKPSITTGKAFADQKGITFNFDAANCNVPAVYSGIITTEAGQINTPTQLTVDTTVIDGSLGSRFIPNAAQSSALSIATYTNFEAGATIRVEEGAFAGSFTLALANGGSVTLTATGDYVDLFFVEANLPVVINSNL